jgi:hypothetical protein
MQMIDYFTGISHIDLLLGLSGIDLVCGQLGTTGKLYNFDKGFTC